MSSTRTPFKNAAKILNSLTGGNEYESGYMDVSPDALEHIAEFALGGAGTFGLRSMNAFEKWLAGEELESREVPFLRRVMGEPDRNIAVADYYDRKVKLEQKEAAIQGLRGADRIKYREQNQDYVTMFGVLNSIERKLRKIRQMESQLRSRAALSPANAEQYATGLEVLEERKQKLYDQFNNLYDKRVGRTK
jgi:2-oxo-4-hydroxy-4-carboxy--5-ureidoimidazoline (OHCU) decarboxylase